jgi:hypothetical protein
MPSALISSYTAHVGRQGLLGTDRLLVLWHKLVGSDVENESRSEVCCADRFGEQHHGLQHRGCRRPRALSSASRGQRDLARPASPRTARVRALKPIRRVGYDRGRRHHPPGNRRRTNR